MDISCEIFNYRVRNRISQKEFARRCGISEYTVSKAENKIGRLRMMTEGKIIEFLKEEEKYGR